MYRPATALDDPTVEPASVPWGAGTAIIALIISFAVYFLMSVVLAGIFYVIGRHFANQHMVVFQIISYQFLVLGVAISCYTQVIMRFPNAWHLLGFRLPPWRVLALSAASIVPIYLTIALIYALFQTFFPEFGLKGNTSNLLPKGQHPGVILSIVFAINLAVEAPITEELLFRGLVFQGIASSLKGRLASRGAVVAGAVVSGTIFGAVHFEPHTAPVLIFVGICLAYVFTYGRSILASMLVHAIFNAIAVAVLLGSL